MSFVANDYLKALLALLPRGIFWQKTATSNMTKTLSMYMTEVQRLADRAVHLLVDSFPRTTDELLPVWESTLGLPDPCQGVAPSIALRRDQVVARLTGIGGQSISSIVAFAASLGYQITITEYRPFRAGRSSVGQALNGSDFANYWLVNAPAVTVTKFSVGQNAAGEALATWGNTVLECEIRAKAPSHTVVSFGYQ